MYKKFEHIPNSSDTGFLYIVDIDSYDMNPTVKIDGLIKIGKTDQTIKSRLSSYKSNISNIVFYRCSDPTNAERLLKSYIKHKENILPKYGNEYFCSSLRYIFTSFLKYFSKLDRTVLNNINFNSNVVFNIIEKDIKNKTFEFNNIDTKTLKEEHEKDCLENNICTFCGSKFTCVENLQLHIKNTKPCCDKSKEEYNIKCIWCEQPFVSTLYLNMHQCSEDKDKVLISYINKLKTKKEHSDLMFKQLTDVIYQKDIEIIEQRKYINVLEEKIKTNIRSTGIDEKYTFTLSCDKPLLIESKRFLGLIEQYPILKSLEEGGEATANWFLKYALISEKGNIAIECTSKTRKIFKYIDPYDKVRTISGHELLSIVEVCVPEKEDIVKDKKFKKSFLLTLSNSTYINRYVS